MSRRWTLRLAVCLVAGSAVLTGCSDKQEASDSLPSTSSAAPTEDELPPLGPEDLPMPDEARTQDAAGAEAFVRYYFELINRTSTVMDAQPLRDLSDGCRDCDRIADNVEKDAAAGYQYRGGTVTITDTGPPLLKPGTAEIGLIVDQAPSYAVDSAGAEVDELALPAYADVSGAASMLWNPEQKTWLMSSFTLG